MAKSEAEIQQEILLALGSRPDVRLWRQNSGHAVPLNEIQKAIRLGHKPRPVTYGVNGCGDLSGILTIKLGALLLGLRLEVEVKSETGKQAPDQERFEAMIRAKGGIYILARSAEEAIAKLEAEIQRLLAIPEPEPSIETTCAGCKERPNCAMYGTLGECSLFPDARYEEA